MTLRRLAYVAAVLVASGCHSLLTPPDGGARPGEDLAVSAGEDMTSGDFSVAGMASGDMSCTPTITSCAGLCGPIPDRCLGRDVECGGCGMGEVCNLASHVCEVPKSTCADLNAKCGNARNSCGTRLFCGDCAAGMQCNNDTNHLLRQHGQLPGQQLQHQLRRHVITRPAARTWPVAAAPAATSISPASGAARRRSWCRSTSWCCSIARARSATA